MNEALKLDNIQDYFQTIGRTVDRNYVYGFIEPKKRDYLLWGNFVGFKFKFQIIAFYPDEIVMAAITQMGKFAEETSVISKEDIQSISVKEGLMQYKVVIHTNDQKLKIKCNKFVMNTPWQKENLAFLESVEWYKKELEK